MIELEICANSLTSALAAQDGGATRVELCDNLGEGGTTPSYGQIALAKSTLSIPVFPIIRPRGGDFLYSDLEFELMKADVIACRTLGCSGVVYGILTPEGRIDAERCSVLKELASPMAVAFHRAFDMTISLSESLETLIEIGFVRVLSSGAAPTAIEGAAVLCELIKQAANRIQVMPGSGIRLENVKELVETTSAKAVHASLLVSMESKMVFKNSRATMGEVKNEYLTLVTSTSLVAEVVKVLYCLNNSGDR
ncbi:MAG: Copper homeostasis protein CutC [Pedobacter sp.]|jgi:copper homeostasis protein|nr:Copper homeostasis protein CutC [Pedobacter sp.]